MAKQNKIPPYPVETTGMPLHLDQEKLNTSQFFPGPFFAPFFFPRPFFFFAFNPFFRPFRRFGPY
ncbi:hypothetical protein [Thermoactinomyces mirandus]|uniref:Uncharacterized protein n=1 Tax=Thermoactinomyces mirandus TaxID=2756294 RepID=A0A7W1XSQ5_9BACL|nr:hypothetical protein [Thermoactinomyces mirandus]MBA4602598.1 hypothetical protein [Thermoactinomyces mirandus]